MARKQKRFLAIGLALTIMVVAVAAMNQGEPPVHIFRVTLGLNDKEPSNWNGQVTVTGGEVVTLSGWRFENKDAVEGTTVWKCQTRNYIAPENRYPIIPAAGLPKTPVVQQPWPNGVTITVRGDTPTVTIALRNGNIQFRAPDLLLGEPKTFLDGSIRVDRLPAISVVRPPSSSNTDAVQDDYPAFWIRYKTGKHYLAWQAYQKGKDRILLVERDGPHGRWSQPLDVAGLGDHFRVALANTHDDTIWVVWCSQRNNNWDLFGRPYKDGQLAPEVKLTNGEGPNIWHTMTTDTHGRAWLVWQGFRKGQGRIFARCADGDGWHEPVQVSTSKANDWNPAVTADPSEDRVWIGWDTYENGNYNIRVRSIAGGPKPLPGEILKPEETPLFNAHVNLACDKAGRLWAAWDESGPQWGKDTGHLFPESPATRLYQSRRIRVKVLVKGQWLEPVDEFDKVLPSDMKEFNELPQLQVDSDGRMWMAFRHRTVRNPRADGWAAQGRWDVYATAFLGDRWLAPFVLEQSGGRNDMRVTSQRDRDGQAYFAYATDNRAWMPPAMPPRNSSVAVSRLGGAGKPVEAKWAQRRSENPPVALVHPREKEQVARIRDYKVESGGKTYRIYRGDLHRHTDISQDGIGDGSLMDLHRYALDAAAMDFILVGDHNMGHDNEYSWWRTQKANDLYTIPGAFISMYGYERSVPYPNGHRNVIWVERGHRTLPLPRAGMSKQFAEDTQNLYAYLRRTGGICTLHSSATGQGTNWAEAIDSALEPFVEIFQGFHGSYEIPGAPLVINENSDIIHSSFKDDGYVSLALDKGYRLGFQASSDHVSTHVSYACILAQEFSRKGLVEAMRQRHTYAATDNIVLDVRMGSLGIMGDEVRTNQPRLDVRLLGTGPIDRVEVIRNGEVIHTARPKKNEEEIRFSWEDEKPKKGEKPSYYYVRVTQKDGQMAWGSPIWVHGEN
ncbi:MAG TPA: CehA/McbA family metallohydrolase [Gemmataceae bacterium]|nr:CehA/McbA family metallohydrolase [Gemmataceae bacterium]